MHNQNLNNLLRYKNQKIWNFEYDISDKIMYIENMY
jgi:hypothetical protein